MIRSEAEDRDSDRDDAELDQSKLKPRAAPWDRNLRVLRVVSIRKHPPSPAHDGS